MKEEVFIQDARNYDLEILEAEIQYHAYKLKVLEDEKHRRELIELVKKSLGW